MQGKDLVYKMLTVDVEKRATIASILNHPVRRMLQRLHPVMMMFSRLIISLLSVARGHKTGYKKRLDGRKQSSTGVGRIVRVPQYQYAREPY